jgi:hypothetical protein
MKEMRLFEIGLKEDPRRSGYEEKFNVAAEDAHEAEEKARAWLLESHIAWWEEEGRIMEEVDMEAENIKPTVEALSFALEEQLDVIRGMHLAKLYDIGTLIV